MFEPTLVILAAGLGSRYGGLKQIDTVGNNGESIIDFSIYDAYRAGFKKVVLIIRKEHAGLFDEHITNKIKPFVDVDYAFQDVRNLPEPFVCPEERTKPWGTTQALLVTEPYVNGPFMVINADDFYGREAFELMYAFLRDKVADNKFAMVGYQLSNTLTDNGTVTRGVCEIRDGYLSKIVETQKIAKIDGEPYAINEDDSKTKLQDGLVSMNFWGFNASVYPLLQKEFVKFLAEKGTELKAESVIPTVIGELINQNEVSVEVLPTKAEWFGVTYPQDKAKVAAKILEYKAQGFYPFDLWK